MTLTPATLFARETIWQSWLDIEATLAEVQAEMGMIPDWAAQGIRKAATLERLGADALRADIAVTHAPVLSMSRLLSQAAGDAGAYVHWGATTQNVMQTARILLVREADIRIREALDGSLIRLADMAEAHAQTLMAGRTNRQHALPITFGFKVAGWIEELSRAVDRLDGGKRRLSVLPFGGAVGAMHAYGTDGKELNARLAARLGLAPMIVAGRAVNDVFADYVLQLSLLAMSIERIAGEIYLLMTEEIGEVSERLDSGTVGSSTMPHKINPKYVVGVLSAAMELRCIAGTALETGRSSHEGDAAPNQLVSNLLDRAVPLAWTLSQDFAALLSRTQVNAARMAANAQRSGGAIATEQLMMLLAPMTGRAKAHDLIHHALDHRTNPEMSVIDAMIADPDIMAHLQKDQVQTALDPAGYVGDSVRISHDAAAMARSLIKAR
ncbi:lyase family protein [Primorskyibacter flagellatus]|uniref:lyase family protein n=1 Tax=Primorskyibacter flagellatus TaxID=1387277 RepID=UPI003A8E3D0D